MGNPRRPIRLTVSLALLLAVGGCRSAPRMTMPELRWPWSGDDAPAAKKPVEESYDWAGEFPEVPMPPETARLSECWYWQIGAEDMLDAYRQQATFKLNRDRIRRGLDPEVAAVDLALMTGTVDRRLRFVDRMGELCRAKVEDERAGESAPPTRLPPPGFKPDFGSGAPGSSPRMGP